jgi:hypothetical protein
MENAARKKIYPPARRCRAASLAAADVLPLLRRRGFEPPQARCSLAPQASVSTNSTTAASQVGKKVKYFAASVNTYTRPEKKCCFELIVAVILSAQCTDSRVNKVTPPGRLFCISGNDLNPFLEFFFFFEFKVFIQKICAILEPFSGFGSYHMFNFACLLFSLFRRKQQDFMQK